MKKILVLQSYLNWECNNPWVKLAIDNICEKNKIVPKTEYDCIPDLFEFRTCDEIIDLLVRENQLNEFKICEIPDDYTDIVIKRFGDFEYLFYVKDGKMYNEENELVAGERG